jgi:hypothetical protein
MIDLLINFIVELNYKEWLQFLRLYDYNLVWNSLRVFIIRFEDYNA